VGKPVRRIVQPVEQTVRQILQNVGHRGHGGGSPLPVAADGKPIKYLRHTHAESIIIKILPNQR
jgi:hypothetical protein